LSAYMPFFHRTARLPPSPPLFPHILLMLQRLLSLVHCPNTFATICFLHSIPSLLDGALKRQFLYLLLFLLLNLSQLNFLAIFSSRSFWQPNSLGLLPLLPFSRSLCCRSPFQRLAIPFFTHTYASSLRMSYTPPPTLLFFFSFLSNRIDCLVGLTVKVQMNIPETDHQFPHDSGNHYVMNDKTTSHPKQIFSKKLTSSFYFVAE